MCLSCTLAWKALLFLRFQLAKWKVQFLVSVSSTTIKREQFAKRYQVPDF